MKLSVSLTDEDVDVLDAYVRSEGLTSRSAAVQSAIRQLTRRDLEDDYAAAWDAWDASGDYAAWESTSGDGMVDASR